MPAPDRKRPAVAGPLPAHCRPTGVELALHWPFSHQFLGPGPLVCYRQTALRFATYFKKYFFFIHLNFFINFHQPIT